MPVKQWNLAESLETESFESHKKLLCVQHVGTTSEQALLKCSNPAFNLKKIESLFQRPLSDFCIVNAACGHFEMCMTSVGPFVRML